MPSKVVDHPCVNRHLPSRRAAAAAAVWTQSNGVVFGGPASDRAQKITGRGRAPTSAIAPSPFAGTASKDRVTGKRMFPKKPDAVFSAATKLPIKPPVYAVGDQYSRRPHESHHGRKHVPSANRTSIVLPSDPETACSDVTAKKRHHPCAWQQSRDKPGKFKSTPASARQIGMSVQQEAGRGGKRRVFRV